MNCRRKLGKTRAQESFDHYYTPKYAWENIKHLIPKGKSIWEPFYGESCKSHQFLTELGFNVIYEEQDFFECLPKGELVVSNPPYSIKQKILPRMFDNGQPFILLLPQGILNTKWFQKLMRQNKLQIIIPSKRIGFIKLVDGVADYEQKYIPNSFDCIYYCWKIGLENDITLLPD